MNKPYHCDKCDSSDFGVEVSYYADPPVIEVYCKNCGKVAVVKELAN